MKTGFIFKIACLCFMGAVSSAAQEIASLRLTAWNLESGECDYNLLGRQMGQKRLEALEAGLARRSPSP